MKPTRSLIPAVIAAVALTLSACGGGSDPLGQTSAGPSGSGEGSAAGGAPIVVGSANFTESQVLAQLYAQAMQAKGVEASVKPNIGSREVYIRALKDASISIIPEYTGNLLLYFDKSATATTAEEIEKALPEAAGSDLAVLEASKAADQDVYVTTRAYAEKNSLTALGDLQKVDQDAILGGPSELKDRAYGPPGLKEEYSVTFKQFKPYDAPAVKVRDLNDDKIQVATFFTTDAAIADNDYVQLEDPQSMILPQNVLPLVRSDVASNDTATEALNAVSAALTTEDLTALNKKVDVDRDDPDSVAGEWLKSKGLA